MVIIGYQFVTDFSFCDSFLCLVYIDDFSLRREKEKEKESVGRVGRENEW
jgi:hypothetical protein